MAYLELAHSKLRACFSPAVVMVTNLFMVGSPSVDLFEGAGCFLTTGVTDMEALGAGVEVDGCEGETITSSSSSLMTLGSVEPVVPGALAPAGVGVALVGVVVVGGSQMSRCASSRLVSSG